MDTELIKCLHKLSTKANRIILSKIEINHIVQIEDEFELEQFLDAYCCGFQVDLKNTNENTINIIIKNLVSAIDSNCGNSIDLTKYSKKDNFVYSSTKNPNERSVYKRYNIDSFSPKDISIFKEIWLFDFVENLKKILFNIKNILNISQLENIKKPVVVKKKLSDFIENVGEKQNLIEDLKKKFPTEKGKGIKAMIKILQENDIIIIPDRQFKEFYTSLKNDFKGDIGSYTSINDVKDTDFDNTYLNNFKKKLTPLITKYKKI